MAGSVRRKGRSRVAKKISIKAEVKVEKLIPGGVTLGYYNEKPLFVEGGLPGEFLEVEIYKQNSKGSWARLTKVLVASADRIKPLCKSYEECGGCNLQHLSYEDQLSWKESVLSQQLKRIGGLVESPKINMHPSKPWAYRNRARFHKAKNGWGFKGSKTDRVIQIDHCKVMDDAVNEWLESNDCRDLNSSELNLQSDGQNVKMSGQGKLSIKVNDVVFPVKPGAFFQSNQSLLDEFVEVAVGGESGKVAMDLFAGIGFFSAFLEKRFEKVIAVERDVKCKKVAKSYLGSKVDYYTETVEEWLLDFNQSKKIDFLIVDPPRAGLGLEVVEHIYEVNPERLTYVSCNPDTWSRDVKWLNGLGWELSELHCFDFYPQTHHLEVVSSFLKKR